MKHLRASRFLALSFAVFFVSRLSAQLPVDGEVWKERCNLLGNTFKAAGPSGAIPPALVNATRGVPGMQFYTLAVDRASHREHFVACTLYYMAAVADRNGNGGKADPKMAANYAVLGGSELKLATRQKLKLVERLKRDEMKVEAVGKSLTLTPPQTEAVLGASTTTPVTLTP